MEDAACSLLEGTTGSTKGFILEINMTKVIKILRVVLSIKSHFFRFDLPAYKLFEEAFVLKSEAL
jgi:hypothetical protein